MSSITKTVKCVTCGSYIHDTQRCDVWFNRVYCRTDKIYKKNCNCYDCEKKCRYCNDYLYYAEKCLSNHNGNRCLECNEFMCDNKCHIDHTKPFCKFCNLPIYKSDDMCINNHKENDPICSDCNMPESPDFKHHHDGVKCRICDSLLESGVCIYNCVDGGNFCIHCNHEGVIHNCCLQCEKDNNGQFTKRAIK